MRRSTQRYRGHRENAGHRAGGCADTRKGYRSYLCEWLERRMMLAADVDFGALTGRVLRRGETVGSLFSFFNSSVRTYAFSLNSSATVDVQVSRQSSLVFDSGAFLDLSDGQVVGNTIEPGTFARESDNPGSDDESLHLGLPAGHYLVEVGGANNTTDVTYDLAIAADFADGKGALQGDGTFAFNAAAGRDLGRLSTASTRSVNDFLGFLDTSNSAAGDSIDTYPFDIPAFGSINITMDQVVTDPAGGLVSIDMGLYQDVNHDGQLQLSERMNLQTATPGQIKTIDRSINAGQYVLVVSHVTPGVSVGGSNYHLSFGYGVADGAGETPATARDLGTLGGNPQNLTEYISSADKSDFYRFATVAGGPFVFNGTAQGDGADIRLQLIRDANGNGQVDAGEVIAVGDGLGGHAVHMSIPFAQPGTYFVAVSQLAAEGPYALSISNIDTDRAGNTLGTATNIGDLFGRVENLTDFVSSTDTNDIYKFSLTAAATISASFPATGTGTNADLQLIEDLNNNGAIEANEVLAASTNAGNAGESIFRASSAGTYFVRVFRVTGNPSYALTLTADSAGGTLATARQFRLSGQAGQSDTIEFVGPDDPVDVYKIELTSNLRVGTFLSLAAEPLNVTIGQDTNGNGVIDSREILLTRSLGAPPSDRVFLNLPAGTYYVTVTDPSGAGTNYGIVFATAPFDNAGATPASARNLGILGARQNFSEFVGDGSINAMDDTEDFYRFTLANNGPFVFNSLASAASGSAVVQLIRDDNFNQRVDPGEVLFSSATVGTTPASLVTTLSVTGTYYVQVLRVSGEVNYSLGLSATSTDGAGNTLPAAASMGPLANTLAASGFVGGIDPEDVYGFSIPSGIQISVALTGAPASVSVDIIRDRNNNGVIDPGETLGTVSGSRAGSPGLLPLAAAGAYFARVHTIGTDSGYALSLNLVKPLMPGDINLDNTVNFADLLTLAQNFNHVGNATFAQGDLNGDGAVNFSDLLILAQNFNRTSPAVAESARASLKAQIGTSAAMRHRGPGRG